jgi:hypothetical protein
MFRVPVAVGMGKGADILFLSVAESNLFRLLQS